MISLRRRDERGHADYGWLDTYHTFSFADYYDPAHVNFRALRVINEDRVQPGRGFGTHPHRDMEILTYVLEGALEHKDSMGNGSVIHAGEVQRMTAGTGITHSEFNPSAEEIVHFLQIWILPETTGLEPSYEQQAIHPEHTKGHWLMVASRDGRGESLTIHQDVTVMAAVLGKAAWLSHSPAPGRYAWVQVVRGSVAVNGRMLVAGDGAAISHESVVHLTGGDEKGELLLFDLA